MSQRRAPPAPTRSAPPARPAAPVRGSAGVAAPPSPARNESQSTGFFASLGFRSGPSKRTGNVAAYTSMMNGGSGGQGAGGRGGGGGGGGRRPPPRQAAPSAPVQCEFDRDLLSLISFSTLTMIHCFSLHQCRTDVQLYRQHGEVVQQRGQGCAGSGLWWRWLVLLFSLFVFLFSLFSLLFSLFDQGPYHRISIPFHPIQPNSTPTHSPSHPIPHHPIPFHPISPHPI